MYLKKDKKLEIHTRINVHSSHDRIISNFDYIMILNTLSGSIYNVLSQYQIYSWIISDCRSERINLYNNDIYTDLKVPFFA